MKFSQMVEPQRGSVVAYAKEMENGIWREVRETKERILGYLFGLNAGGLVAGAAYLSEKGPKVLVLVAMILFLFGLAAAVIRAALDYFDCEAVAASIKADVRRFYEDQIEWDQLLGAHRAVRPNWHYISLGVASGVLFFIGLIIGIVECVISVRAALP